MMASEIPPGHLGNLTPYEEHLLQHAWTHLLRLTLSEHEHEPLHPRIPLLTSLLHSRMPSIFTSKTIARNGGGITTLRQLLWNIILSDHPDATVLRFLRARKWNMPESMGMLCATLEWRNVSFLDSALVFYGDSVDLLPPPPSSLSDDEEEDGNGKSGKRGKKERGKKGKGDMNSLAAQYRTGKAYTRGVDRQGRPVLVVRVRLHDPAAQTEEAMEQFVLHNIETMRTVMNHFSSSSSSSSSSNDNNNNTTTNGDNQNLNTSQSEGESEKGGEKGGGGGRDRVCLVFDLSGFSLKNMDLHLVKFLARVFEARYPETLGIVLVHQAPVVFGGVWKMIRPLLDPVIASKIKFTKTTQDLQEFIAPENLQACYGGLDNWEYQYREPIPGENAAMKTAEREKVLVERDALIIEFERLTAQWAGWDPVSVEARKLNADRDKLIARLRESFWRLDPYMRARTHYHRLGVIDGRGGVDYKAER